MMKKIFLIPFYCCFSFVLTAQNDFLSSTINNDLVKMNQIESIQKGMIGFSLVDIKDGEKIVGFNDQKVLTPASNMKLISTALGMKVLGSDYQFQTKIYLEGTIQNDTLYGNIIFVGGGDPTLGAERFKNLKNIDELVMDVYQFFVKNKISYLNGNIQLDLSYYGWEVMPDNWFYGDMGNYYGTGIHSLNINENLFHLYLKTNHVIGSKATIVKTIPYQYQKINSDVTAGPANSGDQCYIYSAPYVNEIFARGTVPINQTSFDVKGAITNPPLYFSQYLVNFLKTKGVFDDQNKIIEMYTPKSIINGVNVLDSLVWYSPKLSEIAEQTNLYSINLYAESIYRAMGQKLVGSTKYTKINEAVLDYLKSNGIETSGWNLQDGSGMSYNNAITTSQMTSILYWISKDSVFNDYKNTIAIAGQTGTVWKLGKGTNLEGRALVKSGTLNRVTCYSGYIQNLSGKWYAFSFFCNGFEGKASVFIKEMEKILIKVANSK